MVDLFPNQHLRGTLCDLDQELLSKVPSARHVVTDSAVQTFTACSSGIGIAASLIEGIIATSRILEMMDLSSREVQEALKDLRDCHPLKALTTLDIEAPQGRIHVMEDL